MMRAYAELLFATLLWGFAFICSVWAFEGIGPVWMTSVRFIIAIVMLDLVHRTGLFGLKPIQYRFREWTAMFWPGFFLFATLGLQTVGLKYTTPTKSGFITVLYVLFIPIFEKFLLKYPVRKILWLWIALAVAGTAMICGAWTPDGFSKDFFAAFNYGDFLTLLCAIAAAGHMIITGKIMNSAPSLDRDGNSVAPTKMSPVAYHIYQSAWVVILAGVLGAFMEGFSWVTLLTSGAWSTKVWIGILELGLLSSGVAFLIQVRGQRTVSPSTVGIIVLLESPWAMLFSVWLLNETLSSMQVFGAFLILTAALAESICQMVIEKRAKAKIEPQASLN